MVYLRKSDHHLTGVSTPWKEVNLPGRASVSVSAAEAMKPDTGFVMTQKAAVETDDAKVLLLRAWILRQSFDLVDKDRDGQVDKKEFGLMIRRVMPHITFQGIDKLWHMADSNHDGSVNFSEFKNMLLRSSRKEGQACSSQNESAMTVAAKAIFSLWDQDGSGSVSQQELLSVCKQIEPRVDIQEVAALFHSIDADGSGDISLEEFTTFLTLEAEP